LAKPRPQWQRTTGLRQIEIFDHRLQFPLVCSGPFANRRGRTGERQSLSRMVSVPFETPDKGLARSWSVSNKRQMAPFLSGNPFRMGLAARWGLKSRCGVDLSSIVDTDLNLAFDISSTL
jgi:hypothetical protein